MIKEYLIKKFVICCEIVSWALLSGLGGLLVALQNIATPILGPAEIKALVLGFGMPFVSTCLSALRMLHVTPPNLHDELRDDQT